MHFERTKLLRMGFATLFPGMHSIPPAVLHELHDIPGITNTAADVEEVSSGRRATLPLEEPPPAG